MFDVLAIGAHPDDIEIFMGGAMAAFHGQGLKTGICDLTRGEAGTYGSAEIRARELSKASEILSVEKRVTLDLPDGKVQNTESTRLKVIKVIRDTRPELVFTFADAPMRHPDHQNTGTIVRECCFLAGLKKIDTGQAPFRPSACIGFPELIPAGEPDFVVDITNFWETKLNAIRAYGSQVTAEGENDGNTKTFIRSNRFWEVLEARAVMAGAKVGANLGEPFFSDQPLRIKDVMAPFIKQELR
ncbi:MAG: bacillithiol biosynthesis deacetylase BshB1 [Acidobacteria bacterium]|nr:bacillithiol biosynthesis deacetylase BshB1 [Acidobacteriota bacterium]